MGRRSYSAGSWPSKEARNNGMPKVMSDARMTTPGMPFDGQRAIFGGFDVVSSL